MGVFDVPASRLIGHVAEGLEKDLKIPKPAFVGFVKTGAHVERAPQLDNWYYRRTASILYRIFKEGPVGVGSLRTYYGGKKNRGVKPEKFRKAGGKIIRTGLQSLEKLGFVKLNESKTGRVVTGKGHSYLIKKAKQVKKLLVEEEKKKVVAKPVIVEESVAKEKPKEEAKPVKAKEEMPKAEEKPAEEKPIEKKPVEGKPAEKKPVEEKAVPKEAKK